MQLRQFQKEGVHFLTTDHPKLRGKHHKLLADEMGLGKTPQACVALREIGAQSALIVCPKKIKRTWMRRLVEWGTCRQDQVQIIENSFDFINMRKTPFVIVNRELLVIHGEENKLLRQIFKTYFDVLVYDECQSLKNMDAQITNVILGRNGHNVAAQCQRRWFLSGTIMPNRAAELFILSKTMAPECIRPYTTWPSFGKQFCAGRQDDNGRWHFKGSSNVEELRERLKPFMLRREIKDVEYELPPVVETEVFLDIGTVHIKGEEVSEADTAMATLRKAIGDCKLPHVLEYIQDRMEDGAEKLVVFAFSRSVCEGLAAGLTKYGAALIYGGMTDKWVQKALNDFVKSKKTNIIVCQINAAGEGIDGLQEVCNELVFAELPWSAGDRDQVVGRLRRIGQKKRVHVTSMVAENTMDEAMLGTYWAKKKHIDKLLKGEGMSLEQEIRGVNDTLKELIEVLRGNGGVAVALANADKEAASEKQKSEPTPPPLDKKASTSMPSEDSSKQVSKDEEEATLDAMKDTLRELLDALGGEQPARDAVAKIIEKEGKAKKLGDVKKEHYAAVIKKAKAELAKAAKKAEADDPLGGLE